MNYLDFSHHSNKAKSKKSKGIILENPRKRMHIGDLLVEHKLISEGQLDVPYVDLKQYRYQQEVLHLLPETLARRYRAIVLADRKNLNDL